MMSDNELCGRLGGDEFAVVIRDASDRDRVERVAAAVIEQLSQPYEVDHHTLYVGASVGSAIGPRDGADGRDADAQCRSGALPRQGRRRRDALRLMSPRSMPMPKSGASSNSRCAARSIAARCMLQLSAGGRRQERDGGQLRGAAALEQRRAWHGQPGQIHPAGRGHPPDRADRRMGAARGLQGSAEMAQPCPGRGQCLGRAAARSAISPPRWSSAFGAHRAVSRSGSRSK